MNNELNAIASNFNIWEHIEPYGDGHINETFEALPCVRKFILQKINSDVFEKPEEVMENISAVTEHLRKKIIKEGGDPLKETLTIVKTLDGKSFYKTDDGRYYRMYIFIEGARTYNVVEKPEHFYNAAKAFGRFQKLLADFPADKLHETIKDFHNTPKRFADFEKAITNNISGRADNVKKEIEFALKRKNIASAITDAIKDGSIPLRVTHNDTKYNNIMIDDLTGNAVVSLILTLLCLVHFFTTMAILCGLVQIPSVRTRRILTSFTVTLICSNALQGVLLRRWQTRSLPTK